MKIDELLNKYFEGETTCEEERELRSYFTEEQSIPEQLKMYRSFFTSLDAEVKAHHDTGIKEKKAKRTSPSLHRLFYTLGTIAAGVILLIGISTLYQYLSPPPTDYVIINGKRYTDGKLIREQALSALQDVSMSQEDVLDLMFE